jgi:hypothetical protein
MFDIDPTRLDLAEEFRRKPYGRHSAELQRVLNRMRTEPFEGHYVLLRDGRFGPWRLGTFGATPADPIRPPAMSSNRCVKPNGWCSNCAGSA